MVNVPVIMQLEFRQSKLYENMEMPQFQFFDSVVCSQAMGVKDYETDAQTKKESRKRLGELQREDVVGNEGQTEEDRLGRL